MMRTIASIFITLGLILGISFYESKSVEDAFDELHATFETLQEKVELGTASYNDGISARNFWNRKKGTLHFWLPHGSLQELDFQLSEAIGFLFVGDSEGALPKLEILLELTDSIPNSYRFGWKNIF